MKQLDYAQQSSALYKYIELNETVVKTRKVEEIRRRVTRILVGTGIPWNACFDIFQKNNSVERSSGGENGDDG